MKKKKKSQDQNCLPNDLITSSVSEFIVVAP